MSLTSVDMDFNDVQMSAITGNNGEGKSAIVTSMAFTLFNYRKGESYKDYVKIGTEKAVIHLDAYFKGKPIVYDVEIYSGTLGSHKTSPVSRAVVYDGKAKAILKPTDSDEDFGLLMSGLDAEGVN